jgi:DNA repair protein RadA
MVKDAKDKLHDMLNTTEGWEEFESKLSDVKVKCETQPLSENKEPKLKLKTKTLLDDILGYGGLSGGKTLELYGEYASGKTQVLFTLICEAAMEGLVIVIDTEDTFSRERLLQICKARKLDFETVNSHILKYSPESWEEQLAVPCHLPDPLPCEPLTLIVEDSVMALFRSTPEFAGRSKLGKRQELIRFHLRQLKKIAQRYGAIVAYSNQVYDEPVANPFLPKWTCQKAAGGHSIWHIGDIRIFLRKGPNNTRIARLVDSAELAPSERAFQINEKGIDDLSDVQQEEAVKKLKKWEDGQASGEFVKKRKKKKSDEEAIDEVTETEDSEESQTDA